jgi:hypothetical protein
VVSVDYIRRCMAEIDWYVALLFVALKVMLVLVIFLWALCASLPPAAPQPEKIAAAVRFRTELGYLPCLNAAAVICGNHPMTKAHLPVEDCRAYADECFEWARTARSEREREIFLQMARIWLEAAVRAASTSPPTEPGTSTLVRATAPEASIANVRAAVSEARLR